MAADAGTGAAAPATPDGQLKPERYTLPAAAVSAINAPPGALRLELHCIAFSHYCTRARWALAACGLEYEEVPYLPLGHMPGMIRLLRRFNAAPGAPTASSRSPAVTPALAAYSADDGAPLFLLQNSALIARWAALRGAALGSAGAAALYGPGLSLAPPAPRPAAAGGSTERAGKGGEGVDGASKAATGSGGGEMQVVGSDDYYDSVAELELRASNAIGVEARRIIYFHILPLAGVGGAMFANNSGGGVLARAAAWPTYFACRLALPRFLKIDATTAARGGAHLEKEFDFFDALISDRSLISDRGDVKEGRPAAYLCGPSLSAADVSLATLAGPLLGMDAAHAGGRYWTPPLEQLPGPLRAIAERLRARPTGRYVLALWEAHGPALMGAKGGSRDGVAAAAAAPAGGSRL